MTATPAAARKTHTRKNKSTMRSQGKWKEKDIKRVHREMWNIDKCKRTNRGAAGEQENVPHACRCWSVKRITKDTNKLQAIMSCKKVCTQAVMTPNPQPAHIICNNFSKNRQETCQEPRFGRSSMSISEMQLVVVKIWCRPSCPWPRQRKTFFANHIVTWLNTSQIQWSGGKEANCSGLVSCVYFIYQVDSQKPTATSKTMGVSCQSSKMVGRRPQQSANRPQKTGPRSCPANVTYKCNGLFSNLWDWCWEWTFILQ